MTVGAGCAWTAVSNASWLTISGGASGTGSGPVTFNVTANSSTQPRTGTITIGGQTFSVTQNTSTCAFTVSPTSQTVPAAGGNGSATVATTTGCAWTATTSAAWITVTGGATGSGNGSATFTVAPSTFSTQRTGLLTIAGRTFTVTQTACTYTLTPGSRTHTGAGGPGTITVGTSSGCAWQATTTQSWISVSGNGTASGSVSYTVQPNTSSSSRTGSISIGTQVFSVVQSAGGGTAPVSPGGLRIIAIGGSD